MFGGDYKKCPHFNRRHDDENRITKLEVGHEKILGKLDEMEKNDVEQSSFLKKHMEDESVRHADTNKVLVKLSEAVNTLITDKKDRDSTKDKKDRLRDRIFSSVALVVILGIGKLLLDLYATTRVLGVD